MIERVSYLPPRRRFSHAAGRVFSLFSAIPMVLMVTVGFALVVRSWPILRDKPVWDLISGQTWLPSEGKFGFYPFIAGTFWVTTVALVLAVPPCLFTALYLSEYARPKIRTIAKPLLDILAAIPSVVYGVWGILTIVPIVQVIGPKLAKGLYFIPFFVSHNPTGYSILAGGIVLAVMVAPFIIAVTYEVLITVPGGLREASLAVGATKWETVKFAVLRPALPGIIAGVVLGSSCALGETMAVLMVVGNIARVPSSIFDPAYPLPALIANNFGEMLSIPLYDAALMGAALVLLLIVLVFNIISNLILRRILARPWI